MSRHVGVSRGVLMRKYKGFTIPKSSKRAVLGTRYGCYFHWKGGWHFTCIDLHFVDVPDFHSNLHFGHEIEELK